MTNEHQQRVIVITGAASGIGAAVARRVAAPGVQLVLHTGGSQKESQDRLRALGEACERSGSECSLLVADLGDGGRGTECIELAIRKFGRVDQIVHAAGVVKKALPGSLTRAEFDFCMSVMPGTLLELATAALPSLQSSHWGRVVVVSSFIAHKFDDQSLAPASAAAKAAMEVLAKCLALQLAASGTTVNCVVPGYTRKDAGKLGSLTSEGWQKVALLTPTQRLGEADEVAAAIQFLLSKDAAQITGATLNVDGGLTLG